jgi:hypothetical protein
MIILCALVVNHLPTKHLNLHANGTLSPIPKTYKTALLDPHWAAAMQDEVNSLLENHTFGN